MSGTDLWSNSRSSARCRSMSDDGRSSGRTGARARLDVISERADKSTSSRAAVPAALLGVSPANTKADEMCEGTGGTPAPLTRPAICDAVEVEVRPGEVSQVVEHLFRHEGAKMVATLTRIFGIEHLTLAEDVVQEALARALQTWPFYGIPQNPAAWIMRASRNLALDVVRRQKVFRNKEAEIVHLMEAATPSSRLVPIEDNEIADDGLRMMFVCCHPLIPAEAQ